MSPARSDLRLDTPALEPSDDFVLRLAAAARTSSSAAAPRRRRRQFATALAAFVGISGVTVGGAWAAGAIDVPGLPSSPLRESVVTPDAPEPAGVPAGDADSNRAEEREAPVGQKKPGDAANDPAAKKADPPGRPNRPDKPAKPAKPAKPEKSAPGEGGNGQGGNGQGEVRREDKGDNGQHGGQQQEKVRGKSTDRGSKPPVDDRG